MPGVCYIIEVEVLIMGKVRAHITNFLGIINGQLQDFSSSLIDVQGRISVVMLEKAGLSDCNIYLTGTRVR